MALFPTAQTDARCHTRSDQTAGVRWREREHTRLNERQVARRTSCVALTINGFEPQRCCCAMRYRQAATRVSCFSCVKD